jgi:TctA family transporter
MLISRGDITVFVQRPISAVFVALCALLIGSQIYFRLKGAKPPIEPSLDHTATPTDGSLTPATPAE